ncbi:eEF1A lysine and N-terminal methyltransferase homolog isoform X3 [Ostrinia furnacalis]|uniref:eEF1A lysine and N-terminal methyltransferase homolog isoform X1 n=1 Tax=Ostrinia furnacalis TaxID=93504 RepID=UPI00103A303E|nr:eEF1A lysine and N-terminal methyltransferase homolog isoform X1 [Ostrinia furnacalis]XP_028174755.1 eEF1A lysine and N-terminal methyltransferase homolog isoform X2 [Ostrinia furnacalis]XP_028174756.1 eEF1A lysine and N-terminal methyltransferase homolog isoform X3 [Ostrinia furnacalis]
MNLLPKSHKEFSEKDYWNKFFKKRGNKAFEWYGEYMELCSQLHKYIKPKDSILITGCGNSSLSADLYDVGYTNITNIDVSEVVIRQMTSINAHRTNMKFLCMDAMKTTFSDEEFNVVLDKGTLDALMPDDGEETQQGIDKYFSEIKRVLKIGGRFVCISLLQSHILKKLLDTFCDKSWMFRVVRCHEAEEKNAENGDGTTLPVFVVVATKFKAMPQLILEVCLAGDKMQRVASPDELFGYIKSAQDTAFVTNGLAKTSLDEDNEVSLDLMQPGEDSPRYTLYIVDQKKSQAINKYAVFIVPQGRESEWLFGTPAGRRQLQDSARFGRLVVAVLRRGHHFESLDAVKEELTHSAKMLIPYGFTGQIPFLSLGSEVGRRVKVHEGTSPISGPFVVEDVDVDGETHRRLVFLDNQFLVQSEAKLKSVKRKNKTKLVVDFGHISLYHSFMCVGAALARRGRAAVLGLGGGSLCMFLRKCIDDLKVTAVELDPAMLEVAREHFELKLDEQFDVQIKDGVDFLREEAQAGHKFETVMFDMDSKDRALGLSCPPPQFLHNQVLDDVKAILTDDGHFILNLVCRDTVLQASILDTIKTHFKHVATVKLYEEVNEIVFASNGTAYSNESFEEAIKSINQAARQKGLVKVRCVDLKDFMQSTNIIS